MGRRQREQPIDREDETFRDIDGSAAAIEVKRHVVDERGGRDHDHRADRERGKHLHQREAIPGSHDVPVAHRDHSGRPSRTVSALITRGANNRWILNPRASLHPNTRYTARLVGGARAIRDTANNTLRTQTWSFRTR